MQIFGLPFRFTSFAFQFETETIPMCVHGSAMLKARVLIHSGHQLQTFLFNFAGRTFEELSSNTRMEVRKSNSAIVCATCTHWFANSVRWPEWNGRQPVSQRQSVIVLADRVCSEIPFRSGSENRWRDKYFSSSYKYFHFAATHQHPHLLPRHSKAICLLAVCRHRILAPLLERTGGRQCVNSQMGLIMQNCRSNRWVGVSGQKR